MAARTLRFSTATKSSCYCEIMSGHSTKSRWDLRASDAERDHVIDLLQRAVGQGMLDLEEFSERTDKVLGARTRAEVNQVLADLPDLVPNEPREADVLVLRAVLSGLRRQGSWQVPRRLLITSTLGRIRLNFTKAKLAEPTVQVELAITGGRVELRVPRRAKVSKEKVRVTGGRIKDRREPRESRRTTPNFILSGRLLAGELKITRPRPWQRNK